MREPGHIGLNIVFLDPGMGGMETYVRQLVPNLLGLRPDLRLSIFVNPVARPALAAEPWADSVDLVTHPALGRRYTRALSELTVLGLLANRRKVDVLHSLGMIAPLRTDAVSVVTVPDLIWLHRPRTFPRLYQGRRSTSPFSGLERPRWPSRPLSPSCVGVSVSARARSFSRSR